MADVNTAEVEAKVDAAFGVGFGDTPPVAKVVEEAKPEPAKPVAVAAPVPEKPRYVRLTEQEWNNTKAAAGKVSSLESQVAKLTGSVPKAEQIVQQVLATVQSKTPAGSPVKLTKEDLAELSEDFPELSEKLLAGLGRAFERVNVNGTAPSSSAPVDIEAAVQTALTRKEKRELEEAHPEWRDIVGAVDMSAGEKPPEGNPFRQWLATQPERYQKKINETESWAVVQGAIDLFHATPKAVTPAKPDKAAARRERFADAVTPRAEGHSPPPNQPMSADDAFAIGFKTGRPH